VLLMAEADLPVGEAKVRAVEAMFDRIAPRYELMNTVLTFGLDRGWRRRAVRELALPAGSRVLDLGCGTGDLCRGLAASGHRAAGVDIAAGMLRRAHTEAPLVRADVLRLPFAEASVDGVISGFTLRNVVDAGAFFRESARVLRIGGRAVFLEVAEPRSATLRRVHALYFRRVVPFIGGAISDRSAYRYLPASTAYLPEPGVLVRMLADAGFTQARRAVLCWGAAQLIMGTRS
jgi:demethylmenaquinone methyltransferase/2-methoxy-6-polyprenyl-1,4-benzoquinol methylase